MWCAPKKRRRTWSSTGTKNTTTRTCIIIVGVETVYVGTRSTGKRICSRYLILTQHSQSIGRIGSVHFHRTGTATSTRIKVPNYRTLLQRNYVTPTSVNSTSYVIRYDVQHHLEEFKFSECVHNLRSFIPFPINHVIQ